MKWGSTVRSCTYIWLMFLKHHIALFLEMGQQSGQLGTGSLDGKLLPSSKREVLHLERKQMCLKLVGGGLSKDLGKGRYIQEDSKVFGRSNYQLNSYRL